MNRVDQLENQYFQLFEDHLSEVAAYRDAQLPFLEEQEAVEAGEMPRFIPEKKYGELVASAQGFIQALTRIPEKFFGGNFDEAGRVLGLPEVRDPLFKEAFQVPRNHLIARPDALLVEGKYIFLEQNISSSVTGNADYALNRYFKNHPLILKLQKKFNLELPSFYASLVEEIKKRYEGKFICLFDVPGFDLQDPELKWVESYLNEAGIDIGSPQSAGKTLTVTADGVFLGTRKVDVLYRTFVSASLFHQEVLKPFVRAHIEGKVEMFHDPTEILYTDKGLLALLSDPKTNGFLSSQERALIDNILPWTRLLRGDSLDFEGEIWEPLDLLDQKQDQFVLKRGYGNQSRFVMIGSDVSEEVWRDSVRLAQAAGNWIIQKYYEVPLRQIPALYEGAPMLFTYMPVDSPYLVNGQGAGLMTRESGFYADPQTGEIKKEIGWVISETIGIPFGEKKK